MVEMNGSVDEGVLELGECLTKKVVNHWFSCQSLFKHFKQPQRAVYLHQQVLVLRVFTVVRLPAQLLHLRHQAPVAHNLQQAGLKRDAQPGDTRGEEGLFV